MSGSVSPVSVPAQERRRVLPRRVFVAVALVSVYVLFVPSAGVPGQLVPHSDKFVHAGLFAALAATGLLSGLPSRVLLPALVAYAGASELVQSLLPFERSGEVWDVVADLVGVVLGSLAARRAVMARRRG